jgi:tight adherence protein B
MSGLVLVAVALLLAAAAVELWWGSAARARRRASLAHVQRQLHSDADLRPGNEIGAGGPAEQPLVELLQRAGLGGGWRVPTVLIVGTLVLSLFAAWRMRSAWAGLVMAALCVLLSVFWLWTRMERQRKKLIAQMPDFLENVVRLTSIGQSLPMAFQSASAHVEQPLREVLDRTLMRMRAGLDLEQALHQSGRIYKVETLDLLEAVIGMSARFGGRTDQVLQRMSDFMRDLEHAQSELKSVTSETRMSSWVLGLLPLVAGGFMMLTNPDFFQPMFREPLGHKLLFIALGLEVVGAFLLYRLAKSL